MKKFLSFLVALMMFSYSYGQTFTWDTLAETMAKEMQDKFAKTLEQSYTAFGLDSKVSCAYVKSTHTLNITILFLKPGVLRQLDDTALEETKKAFLQSFTEECYAGLDEDEETFGEFLDSMISSKGKYILIFKEGNEEKRIEITGEDIKREAVRQDIL